MRGFSFSLRWLFGIVSFLAVGCGLLIYATPLSSRLTFTVAIFVLMTAVVAAIYQARERRAFWAGFAAFGFLYVWLTCGMWQAPDGSAPLRETLVTTQLLGWCYEKLPVRQTTYPISEVVVSLSPPATGGSPYAGGPYEGMMPSGMSGGMSGMPPGARGGGPVMNVTSAVERTDFFAVGHSLCALALAVLGGVITRRLCRTATVPVADPGNA